MRQEQQENVVTEWIKFDPKCPLCWAHISGVLALLRRTGELDDYDDLSIGAGDIVSSAVYETRYTGYKRPTDVYVQKIDPDYFKHLVDWLQHQAPPELAEDFLDKSDVGGDDAMFVCAALDLAARMASNAGARRVV